MRKPDPDDKRNRNKTEIIGEWKSHPNHPQYQISTHGRIRNSHGIISQQKKMRNGAKYKIVNLHP